MLVACFLWESWYNSILLWLFVPAVFVPINGLHQWALSDDINNSDSSVIALTFFIHKLGLIGWAVSAHVEKCIQSARHLYEQFLQDQQIGFVTLEPLRCA